MCCAFTNSTSNCPSRRFHTGFQYTPVDSIATWVTPQARSQSPNSKSSRVNVPNAASVAVGQKPTAHTPLHSSCEHPNRNKLHVQLPSPNSFRCLAEDVNKL